MRESDTYLAILDEGRLDEAKKWLLQIGEQLLGVPDQATRTTINGLTDLGRLDRMGARLTTAADWQDLLATP
jgi:hypothetical protein